MWDEEVDPVLLAGLAHAYLRREQWRARLQAAEIGRMLVGTGSDPEARAIPKTGRTYRPVTPGALMQRIKGIN